MKNLLHKIFCVFGFHGFKLISRDFGIVEGRMSWYNCPHCFKVKLSNKRLDVR